MTAETRATSHAGGTGRPRGGRGRRWVLVLVVLAAAAGVYAGTRWHSTFAPMLGVSQRAAPGVAGRDKGPAEPPKQLWTCGMHPQVIQDRPGDCPICHMKLTPLNPGGTGGDQAADKERKIKYWWDPMMNPPYIADKPGKSPMGMDLVPVYEDEAAGSGTAGAVTIDPAVVQNMGVRVAVVTEGPLARTVRLVGYLDEAQPNVREINLRVSGWVRRLYANTEGQHIQAGGPLFDLYSPELQVTIEELINGRRAKAALTADAGESGAQTAAALYDAAASKLELLGLERAQIDALAKLEAAPPTVTFVSPITGHLTEKPVIEGAAVKMGDRVLKIVDHTTLWLDARVFEKDLPFVKLGAKVAASIASQPGDPITGEIIFIHPHVDMMTRTVVVRVAIPNPSLALKPGMYATVHARSELADRAVLVPREAIIDTGDAQVSFIALGGGKFEPRKVRMGLAGGDGMVQVLEGLTPGDTVVASGQFLLDSESRLREAIQKYLNQKKQAAIPAPTPAAPSPGGSTPTATSTLPMFDATPAQVEKADAVAAAYLALADALGAVQKDTSPTSPPPQLDVTMLIAAAHALHGAVSGTSIEPLAVSVAKTAEGMKGHPLDHQRSMFSALGEKVIALADALPPSAAAAKTLYVMNCPMVPGGARGDWLQTSPDIANPFFATDMKACGQMVRTIPTREGR